MMALKFAVHELGLEFLGNGALIPSIVAGAIFLLGFLLSQVLSDYGEAESTVVELRVALEAIHADVASFARDRPEAGLGALRALLLSIVDELEVGLHVNNPSGDLKAVLAKVDQLTAYFDRLQDTHLSERYIVRLRLQQDSLRRAICLIAYVQQTQVLPSVYLMVQTLAASCLLLMLAFKTLEPLEGVLMTGIISFILLFALLLVRHLDRPFRKGDGMTDDISLFLLRDFAFKLRATENLPSGAPEETDAGG